MNRYLIALCLGSALALGGCSSYSPSVPENYAGPRAQLVDSAKTYSTSKADFFVAERVDDARIVDSLLETRVVNRGRGMSMAPKILERPLVAERPVKIHVKARTEYAAPIQALTSTVFQVTGVIEFTPKANARYAVNGELGDSYSAVWIEDIDSKVTMGNKIEAQGSAKLGILEK
ncbi:hypothetical protein [Rhodoferax saidenbachensis]|uniref:DUF4410 domain-containing protein n=1 Tax=Rhodoferax saidenbachensis TaxID=1484693 RepID=A0ABU1ZLE1_9BURK|nr:hypothetical protein [Rhodoferax saidenbachensis]MDR7306364.1 hypothetical protein [Rhodoferax saidenbachensis]